MSKRFLEVEEIEDLTVEQTKFFFGDGDEEDKEGDEETEQDPETGRGGKADA